MALSEDEQRLLEQMEAALAAEDPKLANALRGTSTRRVHRRRAALAGLAFLIGVLALIGGMEINPLVSIAGFVIMLVATVVAVSSWQYVGRDPDGQPANPGKPGGRPERDFMDRMEERWRHNQDDGF
ncbi:MAG: DUF3040 domain-containing protein [Propionicimonas sp.]|uniref:DUF3040 domain-containing protein n=1 Tax=Propionicimonas sp. TaxID=1955623 RepID=UPI002B1FE846|nr:DUF3040 domain-containing protein [Propionicimonas sp.]MEA4943020.1 DUF3040 domain-containing protein [Propionicimonas sp.]MEA5055147.1 DUF3040 domain-containing protein [Propionicimonas sp.]MEA5118161.1 DUF3040 domain-containing protein [Propionicimonas sp.]